MKNSVEYTEPPRIKQTLETEGGREFTLGDILSVISGQLLSERGVGGVYDILNYMTGDNIYTHQIPRALDECAPALEQQLPELAEVQIPELNRDWKQLSSWLGEMALKLGEKHQVMPLSPEDHDVINPLTELYMILDTLERPQ